jgi:hypothetical protein
MAIDVTAQLRMIYGSASTATLIETLRHLDSAANTKPTPEILLSRSWVITELERRFPEADEAIARAYEEDAVRVAAGADPTDIDYINILIAAIPPQSA